MFFIPNLVMLFVDIVLDVTGIIVISTKFVSITSLFYFKYKGEREKIDSYPGLVTGFTGPRSDQRH